MKKLNFLDKLKKEKKLELVDESKEISDSYILKSDNCLRSAKVLFKEKLYENAVSEAYYAMYNSVLSLFFKCGIKCENHTASIILLDKLFHLKNLKKMLFDAKTERVDKQYYVSEDADSGITEENTNQMIKDAENFILDIKVYINKLSTDRIEEIRRTFENI